MLKRFLTSSIFLLVLLLGFPALGSAEKAVVIDPGHGGIFTGTCGYTHERPKDLCERDINLSVGLKLQNALKGSGIKVYLTRTTDTQFARYLKLKNGSTVGSDYDYRMKKANGFAKGNNDNTIFISVHHNANPVSKKVKGLETYYYDGVHNYHKGYPHDPLQIKYLSDSKRLAESIHPIALKDLRLLDRNIRHNQSFYVIRNAQMPSILVELGYMSNKDEEARIKTAAYQNTAAKALAKGIINYFKVFDVYKNNTKLATFKTKTDAIKYAGKQTAYLQVFDKDRQTFIWNNAKYQVYQKTSGFLKNFVTEKEAIAYAQKKADTRVVSIASGLTTWSNFLSKNYQVSDNNNKVIGSYYLLNDAIKSVGKTANRKIMKLGTNEVIWTNIQGVAITRTINSQKIAGANSIQTALKVSQKLYPSGFTADKADKVVILASNQNRTDALSAVNLTVRYGKAPLLFTQSTGSLLPEVKNEILRLKAKKVVMIGSPSTISTTIEKELQTAGLATERLYGTDLYETNLKTVSTLGNVNGVFLVSGTNYSDALSAASIAAANRWAVVLTEKDRIRPAALSYLKGKEVAILGTSGVINESVANPLRSQNGTAKVHRLAGANQYESLTAMLSYFKNKVNSDTIYVTSGANFLETMAAAPLSMDNKAPFIVVNNSIDRNVDAFLLEYANRNTVKHVNVIGNSVPDSVRNLIISKLK